MASGIESGQIVSIDLESGGIEVKDSCTRIQAKPMSEVQRDIYNAGGLFEYAK
jgi:hypothetical protein